MFRHPTGRREPDCHTSSPRFHPEWDWEAIDAAMSAAGWPVVPANGDSVKRSVQNEEEAK